MLERKRYLRKKEGKSYRLRDREENKGRAFCGAKCPPHFCPPETLFNAGFYLTVTGKSVN